MKATHAPAHGLRVGHVQAALSGLEKRTPEIGRGSWLEGETNGGEGMGAGLNQRYYMHL